MKQPVGRFFYLLSHEENFIPTGYVLLTSNIPILHMRNLRPWEVR